MFLNNSNWLDYALENYDTNLNLKCEIYDDLKNINKIKKSILQYMNGDDRQLRITINDILVLVNVFGVKCSLNLLLFKLEKEYHQIIKTYYYYLRYIDKDISKIKILVDNTDIKELDTDKILLQKLLTIL